MNYAYEYTDQIAYQNFSGPLVIPPYYILEFQADVNNPYADPVVANVHSESISSLGAIKWLMRHSLSW